MIVESNFQEWTRKFNRSTELLNEYLIGIPHELEHVGSTAVPELPAKPILDIDVVVDSDHYGLAVKRLTEFGLIPEGELGIEHRFAFDKFNPFMDTHLYVVVKASEAYFDHIDLREALKMNPLWREAYAKEKYRILSFGVSRIEYQEAKKKVIERILGEYREFRNLHRLGMER